MVPDAVVDALLAAFLLLSGVLAGVLLAVETAIVPVVAVLPADRYVQVHRLLDRRFDPMMPRVNKVSLAVCAALVAAGGGVWPRVAVGCAGLCIIGVAVVSEGWNVRMNRVIDGWDPAAPPPDWPGVRARWAAANRARTLLAVAGFGAAITGAALVW
ncbi:anthrone oxygenase family protein [Actinomadura chokoriensis]|uniref:anthrone oxygenase family protein n=1 Tax=Actinomadura chokoriensis TaxID=454156 RepID=UPI0031F829F8